MSRGERLKMKKKEHNIGIEKESSLHAQIKARYCGDGGETECKLDGFVCDALRPDGAIVEVQTGSFAPLKAKVRRLCPTHPFVIFHPVITHQYI
jgi:hypothetical protein